MKVNPFDKLRDDSNPPTSNKNYVRKYLFLEKDVVDKVEGLSFYNQETKTSILNSLLKRAIELVEKENGEIPLKPKKDRKFKI